MPVCLLLVFNFPGVILKIPRRRQSGLVHANGLLIGSSRHMLCLPAGIQDYLGFYINNKDGITGILEKALVFFFALPKLFLGLQAFIDLLIQQFVCFWQVCGAFLHSHFQFIISFFSRLLSKAVQGRN